MKNALFPGGGFFTFIDSGKVGWMLHTKLALGTRCAQEDMAEEKLVMMKFG